MATVVFDFDSTIISCESLEVILEQELASKPDLQEKIKAITEEGLRGKISFEESLARRLEIAAPTRDQTIGFGKSAYQWLTPGMEELVHDLQASSIDVWLVSGGIIESLLPVGKKLNIPEKQIHAVKLLWDEKGEFLGIDESVSFCRSKVEGSKPLAKSWRSPTIAVGDSMSDYRLYSEGIVDYFIAYTEHFRCEEVLERGVPEARNVKELKKIIEGIVNG